MIEKFSIFNADVLVDEEPNLAIIFENDAVSFCVTNQKNELVKAKKWTACSENEFISLIKNETDDQFKKINIAFHNALVTSLPNVDSIAEAEAVLFLNGGKQHDHLMMDVLDNDTAVAYQISYELLTNISFHYQGANYWHLHSVWIKNLAQLSGSEKIVIHAEEHVFTLILWKDNAIEFCSSYNYTQLNEILFYVLKTVDLYQLDQTVTTIYLSGIEATTQLQMDLQAYFEQVQFCSIPWSANSVAPHYLTSLLYLSTCE